MSNRQVSLNEYTDDKINYNLIKSLTGDDKIFARILKDSVPERPLNDHTLKKLYPFLVGAQLQRLGESWSWIMDEFYHRMALIENEYTQAGEPYIRKIIMKMQSVTITRGVLKIVWDTLEVTNDNDDLLETPTRELQEEVLDISQRTETLCANTCRDCGETPAFLKVNQCGRFEVLCETCRTKKDIYNTKNE